MAGLGSSAPRRCGSGDAGSFGSAAQPSAGVTLSFDSPHETRDPLSLLDYRVQGLLFRCDPREPKVNLFKERSRQRELAFRSRGASEQMTALPCRALSQMEFAVGSVVSPAESPASSEGLIAPPGMPAAKFCPCSLVSKCTVEQSHRGSHQLAGGSVALLEGVPTWTLAPTAPSGSILPHSNRCIPALKLSPQTRSLPKTLSRRSWRLHPPPGVQDLGAHPDFGVVLGLRMGSIHELVAG